MNPAATRPLVGLNVGGLLWIAALAALVLLAAYIYRRHRNGLEPVTVAVAIAAAAALLTLTRGLAGLIVGAVLFGIYQLARLVG